MALVVIGLVAAAARAISGNDHDQQNYSNGGNPGYNGNGQYHNSNNNNGYNDGYRSNGYSSNGYNNNYDTSPYAAYPPQGLTGGRRATRRMNRRMRKAERADMVMSLVHSRSRAAAAVPVQPQPVSGGVPYMNYGDSPVPRAVYSSESQGPMAGSYTGQMPPPAGPEGYRWRDEQSRDRPVSRQIGSASSSTDNLPTYEEAVHKAGKSGKP